MTRAELIAYLEAKADARNAALEEAADAAEAFEIEWREGIDANRNMIVRAIRALKTGPTSVQKMHTTQGTEKP